MTLSTRFCMRWIAPGVVAVAFSTQKSEPSVSSAMAPTWALATSRLAVPPPTGAEAMAPVSVQ